MDRISKLPDETICHIVSFLSAKEAAFTTVLSKRWLNQFTIIPSLYFKDKSKKTQGSLEDFAHGIMALPLSSRLKKISVRCRESVDPLLINHLLCNVLKRGVLSIKLDITVENGYSLPLEMFTCDTLVKLKLGKGFRIAMVPENASLPALKTISLDRIRFYNHPGCAFEALLSACPVLEGLFIEGVEWDHWKWSRTISSSSLRRLAIKRWNNQGFDRTDFKCITFDTPSLVYLAMCDFVPNEYQIVNIASLVEAKLRLFPDDPTSCDPTNLIKGLRNVKILKLLRVYTLAMLYYFSEAIPVFENLIHLTIPTAHGHCWEIMPLLLNNSPNLKTLEIEGPLHYDQNKPESVCECLSGYSWLSSCPVEVLKITACEVTIGDLEQLKHFLAKLPYLKLVKVRVWGTRDDNQKLQLTTDLLMLPRDSVNCKIEVHFNLFEN